MFRFLNSLFIIPLFLLTPFQGFTKPSSISDGARPSITTAPFELKLSNVTDTQGVLRIAIFKTKKDWLAKAFISTELAANDTNCKNAKCHWRHDELPIGEYAIAVYQDINNNGELDTNLVGFPNEPYGFSNEQTVLFSPPNWKKSKFKHDTAFTNHVITLN